MIIDVNKTRLMQVAGFLIKNHSYQFVSVQQSEDEIWLGNASNSEFPVIRLTYQNSGALYFDRNRVLQVHSAICHVFKREGILLQICVNDEQEIENDEEIRITVMNRESMTGFDLNQAFPGIQRSLTPFDNPQVEYAMILKEIELHQKSKSQQKKKLFSSKWPLATISMIAICVLVFLGVLFLNRTHEDTISCAIALGAYYKAFVVLNGDYWRLITCGFVHTDYFHLLMNCMSLFSLGRFCEQVYGPKKMLIILFTSIFAGSAMMHLTNPNIVGLGISAGIYGLTGAFLVYSYSRGYFRQQLFMRQLLNIIFINVLLNFMPGVAVSAHLGGLASGLLCGLVFCDLKVKNLQQNAAVCLIVLLLFSGVKVTLEKELKPIYPKTDLMTADIYRSFGWNQYADDLLANTFKYYLEFEEVSE
ncbi:MAG: rhomboid family intramembrane serine protease [Erysipelotrichaceae bacterium]|nr:rhomboid family intramembrane serine protease [Erysipelotrichaceae bacterium]